MATVTRVKGLDGLRAALARDIAPRLHEMVHAAALVAAKDAMHFAVQNVPIAFGELRASIHVDATRERVRSIADAPHAAAVENGSRPHLVPLEALIRWVKLRGMQGIDKKGNVKSSTRKAWGTTTAEHSAKIAAQIKASEKDGSVDIDAPTRIAKSIQQAILKRGTKPHWFFRKARPIAIASFKRELAEMMRKGLR